MNFRWLFGRMCSWPLDRLARARWFPLFRTFYSRHDWLYDTCRYANSRDFRILFDVGANTGQTCAALVGYFPRAAIHAFEPVESTFRTLRHNFRDFPNVHPHRLALGRVSEARDIVLQHASELNSLQLSAPLLPEVARRTELIEVTTIDEFCADHGVEAIDILKIDAQGFDLAVMQGASRLLAAGRIVYVYVEVSFQAGDPINSPFLPIHEHLATCGYQLSGIYEQWGGGIRNSVLGFANALYVHPGALQRRFPEAPPVGSRGAPPTAPMPPPPAPPDSARGPTNP
jgi:FkbM family methyltransferase